MFNKMYNAFYNRCKVSTLVKQYHKQIAAQYVTACKINVHECYQAHFGRLVSYEIVIIL